ncbi:phosphatase [Legionella dresdenensis]|uniref:Phosphatase n=1 Tax=Legionella dresdenensis TaxID=450200 RepID=A0ABV8CGI7_9GAMM
MRLYPFLLAFAAFSAQADTINNYMNIANNIPKMEMKADAQSQAWARSARNVLGVTDETIAETLLQANETAKAQGHPLFCLPGGMQLNGVTLNNIIQETYNQISSQQSDKNKMTVSQIAWLGVTKKYPCHKMPSGLNHLKIRKQ